MDDIYQGALAESGGDRLHDSGGMTKGGLVTYYVLFVMDLANRQVACSGITPHPDATWMLQVGRNQTDAFSGFCASNGISSWTGSARSTTPFGGCLKVPAVARSAYRHCRPTATLTWSDSMAHPKGRLRIERFLSERNICAAWSLIISNIITGREAIRDLMAELSNRHWRLRQRMVESDEVSVSVECSTPTTETRRDRCISWTGRLSDSLRKLIDLDQNRAG
jgi:hypothetical protein